MLQRISPALYAGLAWLTLLALAGLCYAPGLPGGFLFDDFANLAPLGAQGGVRDADSLRAYLQSGFAGPTGRPLSLLSFLLDARDWPAEAAGFKRSNLILHGLCATLVLACSLGVLRVLAWPARTAWPVALLGAGLWLLHPLWTSTTLYVVQRMAQLSALFALLGLWAWLHGRQWLPHAPRRAYLWMSLALLLGTGLATLAKENGALLPLLIAVVEWVLAGRADASPGSRPCRPWRLVFLWVPSALVLGYVLLQIDFSPGAWPHRDFTQPQRLWTEGRVLWDYLSLLWLPRVEGWGLFQDAYPLSTGWLTPASTLPALLGLGALLAVGGWARRRWPLLSLALLFFLAGHVLESSTIGLELYFEHRNYLPAAFMFLPLGQALHGLRACGWPVAAWLAALATLGLCGALLHTRATLWGDTAQLQLHWAVRQPQSARAQDALVSHLAAQGQMTQAHQVLDAALQRLPHSGLLHVRQLLLRMEEDRATAADFDRAAAALAQVRIDVQVVNGVAVLVEAARRPPAHLPYVQGMRRVLQGLQHNSGFERSVLARDADLQNGLLALSANEMPQAQWRLARAMQQAPHPGVALRILSELATFGQFGSALALVPAAWQVIEQTPERRLQRSRAMYQQELARLQQQLQDDVCVAAPAGADCQAVRLAEPGRD